MQGLQAKQSLMARQAWTVCKHAYMCTAVRPARYPFGNEPYTRIPVINCHSRQHYSREHMGVKPSPQSSRLCLGADSAQHTSASSVKRARTTRYDASYDTATTSFAPSPHITPSRGTLYCGCPTAGSKTLSDLQHALSRAVGLVTTAQICTVLGTCTTRVDDLRTLSFLASMGLEPYTVPKGLTSAGSDLPAKILTCSKHQQQAWKQQKQ